MQKILETKIEQSNDKFTFIISSEIIDRDGDKILIDGIDLENYRKNPIVLYNHNPYESIGYAETLEVKKGTPNQLIATVVITNPEIKEQVSNGSLRATSIGFMVKETEKGALSETEKLKYPKLGSVNLITKSELYEFSIVTIPANPDAVRIKSVIEKIEKNLGDIMEKAGAVLSASNKSKINKAIELLESTITVLGELVAEEEKEVEIVTDIKELKTLIGGDNA